MNKREQQRFANDIGIHQKKKLHSREPKKLYAMHNRTVVRKREIKRKENVKKNSVKVMTTDRGEQRKYEHATGKKRKMRMRWREREKLTNPDE